MTETIQIQEAEYDAILRQAVAVIDRTRAMVAITVCSAIGTAHWVVKQMVALSGSPIGVPLRATVTSWQSAPDPTPEGVGYT